MMIFLILLPFGVFWALMLLTAADMALFAAAATGLAVIAWDQFRGRQLKILGAGSVVLFVGSGFTSRWPIPASARRPSSWPSMPACSRSR